jgi:hypothetical protein
MRSRHPAGSTANGTLPVRTRRSVCLSVKASPAVIRRETSSCPSSDTIDARASRAARALLGSRVTWVLVRRVRATKQLRSLSVPSQSGRQQRHEVEHETHHAMLQCLWPRFERPLAPTQGLLA